MDEIRSGEWVITGVQEHRAAWSVSYQSRAFVESGRISDALVGNGPAVVPKSGADPWLSWSGRRWKSRSPRVGLSSAERMTCRDPR
ncbi:YrhB domain-containing protein [Micromonospora zamorensis]|uniref:YrhB domain-containing protein n=1 Tax=Micromonospora zamorensis TaxID=709883 RepID=UPI000B5AD68D